MIEEVRDIHTRAREMETFMVHPDRNGPHAGCPHQDDDPAGYGRLCRQFSLREYPARGK